MKIGELFIALGFDVDDKKLKSFNDNIKSARNELFKVAAVSGAAVFGIQRFVSGSISAATSLRNFNTETGNSITSLQKWQAAAVLMNASATAEQVSSSFSSMAENIAQVTFGGGSTGEFSRLGVGDVRGMEVGDVIEEIRNNLNKTISLYGVAETTKLLGAVGFNANMINALKLSGREFEGLVEGKILSKNRLKSLVDLGDKFTELTMRLTLFKDRLSADTAPSLIIFIDKAIPLFLDFQKSLSTVGDSLSVFFSSLDPAIMTQFIGFGSALFIVFNPVLSMFLLLAATVWDLGRAIRGLPSISGTALETLDRAVDKGLLGFLNMFKSDDASFFGGMKDYLRDKQARYENRASTNTVNNTYNIQGANAEDIAHTIDRLNQSTLNNTLPDYTRGGVR